MAVVMADGKYSMTGGHRIEAPPVFPEPAATIPGISARGAELARGPGSGDRDGRRQWH
jgi:hypothetical protein